jgi:hypothetical protein
MSQPEETRDTARARRSSPVAATVALFRRVQFVLGLLLVGAGLCAAYFCWAAFSEARAAVRVEVSDASSGVAVKRVEVNPKLEKLFGASAGIDASELKNLGEQELRMYQRSVEKQIEGYRLLSATLALVLGGLCLCLSSPRRQTP